MSQKQSASACTRILVVFILKWEKKTTSHLEIISFIYIYNKKKNPKRMKWDENKTLHWIMRWGWMRWKRNLAFNNDDGKKTVKKTIYIKFFFKKVQLLLLSPLPPAFSFSSSISENRNKITQKMYYPWIHNAVQSWLSLNKIALQ